MTQKKTSQNVSDAVWTSHLSRRDLQPDPASSYELVISPGDTNAIFRSYASASPGLRMSGDQLRAWTTAVEVLRSSLQLHSENETLGLRVADFERRLSRLEESTLSAQTIVLREMDREQAVEEIKGLFASGEVLYYSEIVERLGIDLEVVVNICDELMADGQIGEATDG